MSKIYFAKYLPVDGEIKEGDSYLFADKVLLAPKTFADHDEGSDGKRRKVKLFLCSEDIQIGDMVKDINYPSQIPFLMDGLYLKILKEKGIKDNFYRVVGEISPEATWVKDGDEFDECKVVHYFELNGIWKYVGVRDAEIMRKKGETVKEICKIKGPCGHFH
jgi:hypothetical protein